MFVVLKQSGFLANMPAFHDEYEIGNGRVFEST